jgi:hypothetical protein
MMSAGGEIALGKGKEEATLIGMMRILLGQKNKKKFMWSIQLVEMDADDLKHR